MLLRLVGSFIKSIDIIWYSNCRGIVLSGNNMFNYSFIYLVLLVTSINEMMKGNLIKCNNVT